MPIRKPIVALAIAILLISSFPAVVFADPPDAPLPASGFSQEQILVKFQPNVGLPEAAQIHRQLGGEVKETISGIGVQVVTVPKGQAKEKAKAYGLNARVAYAEPDFVAQALGTPDDAYFGLQWGLTKIGAQQAWEVTTGSPSVNIAILDTGVDLDHPDLANKIISNARFTDSATTDDIHGHGTHVAGIAAAMTNNGIGVTGLGYTASIMNVKVLSDMGAGAYSWVAAGIIWATDNGAEIINMSLGGPSESSALEDAINYAWSKGVVVVAAAGNNGDTVPMYPAHYANCIAVAATDANDARASFSNYGDWVDVAAPGLSIYSTLKNSSYGYMSGTSMASPHVAGLAALVFTAVSDTNGDGKLNDEVRSRIETTCDDIGLSGIGYGRINAARAVGSEPLPPGGITGKVTDDEDGSAISGAQVTAGITTVATDAAGMYTIDGLMPGSYEVTASKESYQTSSSTVTVLEGDTAVADFSLSEIVVLPGSVMGLVMDVKDGSPIVGAMVTDGVRTETTDASGGYTFTDVPAGSYEVTASKEGYENSSLTVDVLSGTEAVADFSLSEIIIPGGIIGTVTDAEDGSALMGVTVTDGARTATTDALGKYTLADVPPGSHAVTASKEGYESTTFSVTVTSGAASQMNFSLNQMQPPATDGMWIDSISFVEKGRNLFVEVMVVTASGGLAGAEVGLRMECTSDEVWSFSGITNTVGSVKFKLGKAPVGSYSAAVTGLTCSGFTWDATKGITAVSYILSG